MTSLLPNRPRGVRRSWRKIAPDLVELAEHLARSSLAYDPKWGAPIEAATYREMGPTRGATLAGWAGKLRRIEAVFASGRRLSISYRKSGHKIERIFWQ